MDDFTTVTPWPMPKKDDCLFYHSMTFPDGENIEAAWDVRGLFQDYIGHYPIRGKTLLDVGTATGFLSFEAEKAGAIVTSLDAATGRELNYIPIEGHQYHGNRPAFIEASNYNLKMLKNSYWYGWHKFASKAAVEYIPIADLPFWDRKFDVVLAGAIVEHLPDPVTMIGNIARLATEAVIIAFVPVNETDELTMIAGDNWAGNTVDHSYTWWILSRGLYRKIFDNLGFSVEFVDSQAIPTFANQTEPVTRKTVIARRRP
jgi:SAM-dependent methyltransferase